MAVSRYHPLSSILHWVMVVMLAWPLWVGRSMERYWAMEGVDGEALLSLHKSIGLLALFVAIARIILRLIIASPPRLPSWEGRLANWTQWGIYVILVLYPLTGYAHHSAYWSNKMSISLWVINVPSMPGLTHEEFWEWAHQMCFYGLSALLTLHISGALFHLLLKRDSVFRKILPFYERK